jgi:hypothetical protein
MKTAGVCPHRDAPSTCRIESNADCFHAVDREIRAAQAHLRTLTTRKSQLLRQRFKHRQRVVAAGRP